jgi:hypothetical protein
VSVSDFMREAARERAERTLSPAQRLEDELRLPLVTTGAAFTKAMHLLGDAGGWPAQAALWQMIERARCVFRTPMPP